jgi:hypothetical protein
MVNIPAALQSQFQALGAIEEAGARKKNHASNTPRTQISLMTGFGT